MSTESVSIEGRYYDGVSPVASPATLTINGSEAQLVRGDITRTYSTDDLLVSPRIGQVDRFIKLSGGGQYHCADQPVLDKLPQEFSSEGLVAWLEKNFAVAIASIVVVIGIVLLGYFYVLPAFAESIVNRIPITTEVSFGKEVLKWFDENEVFQQSEIETERKNIITGEFNQLHDSLELAQFLQLEFRNSEQIGPNAFALPGGTIVITDQMIELAGTDEEILAILAHEAGHVEKRHSMRQILQGSLMALVIATVTSDASTVGATLSGLPAVLLQTKYSREMETEADEFAFALLKENDISSEAFATMMEKVQEEVGEFDELSFISTHPVTSERIKKAKEASK